MYAVPAGKQRPSSSRCLASSVADGEAAQGQQVLVEPLTSLDTTIAKNAVQLTQKLKTFRFSSRLLFIRIYIRRWSWCRILHFCSKFTTRLLITPGLRNSVEVDYS